MPYPQTRPPDASSTILIHEVGRLTPTERDRLFGWGSNIWGSHALGGKKLVCRQPERRFILYAPVAATGASHMSILPVSHVGVVTTTIGGKPVAGIGGVITNGAEQGKGYATKLLMHVESVLAEEGADLLMIFCLEHRASYYRRRGWRPLGYPVEVMQPDDKVVVVEPPYHVMGKSLRGALDVAYVAGRLDGRPW